MPTEEEQHLAVVEEKVRQLLSLADQILSVREHINQELARQYERFSATLRSRVLIGLSLKTLDSFDRLVVDARQVRAECSHHLKTMTEGFIYSHWVTRDSGEGRARLMCAEGYRSRASYHKSLGEEGHAEQWRQLQYRTIEGIRAEWNTFTKTKIKDIARQAGVEGHYHQVYKMACEAAHMGDLMVYMPPQPQEPGLRFADLSLFKTYICLKFGTILACDFLHDASDSLTMNLNQELDGLRGRWSLIVALAPRTSESR